MISKVFSSELNSLLRLRFLCCTRDLLKRNELYFKYRNLNAEF
jgi:hypothetical protein